MQPLLPVFLAFTALLAPRASELRGREGGIDPATEAPGADAGSRLANSGLGRFVHGELGPFIAGVLRCTDAAQLDDRFDDFVEDGLSDRFFREIHALLAAGPEDDAYMLVDAAIGEDGAAALHELRRRFIAVLGERHAPAVDRGFAVLQRANEYVALARAAPDGPVLAEAPPLLSEYLADTDVPLEQRRARLEWDESMLCWLALATLVTDESRSASPWLVDTLVGKWVSGQTALLRQMEAELDGAASSRQEERNARVNDGYQRLVDRAEAAGADVWPLGAGDDD